MSDRGGHVTSGYARRDFLKSALVAVAAGAVQADEVPAAEPQPPAKPIATRGFGKTGLRLPVLGMGSSAMVAAWSLGYGSKPGSVEERAALVRHAYDRGVRYFDTVYKLIATGGFDQALLTRCYFNKGMNTLLSQRNRDFREKCLDKARDLGMAVVAMKVMGVSVYGRMSQYVVPDYDPAARGRLPAAAMRWVMSDERVSLLAIGMGHHEEVDQNANVLASDLTLTEEDRKLLADYSARAYESDRIKNMPVV